MIFFVRPMLCVTNWYTQNSQGMRQGDQHDWQEDAAQRNKDDRVLDDQNPNAPFVLSVGFLENLDQAVEEGEEPEDPFQDGREHHAADDGDVDDVLDGPGRRHAAFVSGSGAKHGGIVRGPRQSE
nr:hypothetical protein CFP56_16739 [Quercus suber]